MSDPLTRSRAGRTLIAFGIYLLLDGLILLAAPAFASRLLDVQGTDSLWARIAAMLLLILGYLCVRSGWESDTLFCRLSVHTRSSVLLFVTAFVYLEGAAPRMLMFGVIDFATAMWTLAALQADAREAALAAPATREGRHRQIAAPPPSARAAST